MFDRVEQKRSRRGCWVTFIVVVPLLSVVCGVYSGFLYVTRPTPEKTLSAFCSTMRSGDDLKAYSQYSNAYQRTYPRQQFESDISADKVILCTYGAIALSGNRAVTRMKLVHASGATNTDTVTLSQQGGGNNDWTIDSGVNLSTPLETVNAFCAAMRSGDYKSAHDQFIGSYQHAYPEQQFTSDVLLDKVISCTHATIAMSGSSAFTHLTLVHASKVTDTDTVALSQDGNDVWKIDNGVNLSTPLETVNTFCIAIQRGDYQMAYTQFTGNFQKTVSEQEFVNAFSQNNVTSCSHDSPTISGTSATAMLKLINASSLTYSDLVILVQDGSDAWKIEDVRLLS